MMQTFEVLNPSYHSRKSRTLASALMVGSLHMAAVYTLLVALDVVPNPVAPPPAPIQVDVIHPAQPKPPPLPLVDQPVLAQPTRPRQVPVPPIEINTPRTGPTISTPPTGTAISAPPQAGATSPLRAIMATHTIPPYPAIAIRLAHEGTARLKIAVDEQGHVVLAEITQSTGHEELDAAAVAWVKAHWRYQPMLKDGQAVAANTAAAVTFRLDQAH